MDREKRMRHAIRLSVGPQRYVERLVSSHVAAGAEGMPKI